MSSFSGLNTALSSLIAQRQALDVAGQNIANANTIGYTRQRANLASVEALSSPSMFSAGLTTGNGTGVTGIARLGDIFLDARVRAETGSASFAATKADAYARLESTIAEPGDLGVSDALQKFWVGWEDLGNNPGSAAFRNVLLENATALTQRISAGHAAVATQWGQTRTELEAAVVDVNSSAEMVAGLNQSIRGVLVSGGSANELIDQRNQLITGLSSLVGASAVERSDGTVDVLIGGNAIVRGDKAYSIEINANSLTMGADVTVSWKGGAQLGAESGMVVGMVNTLATAAKGGILTGVAADYDTVADKLISMVNTQHGSAVTAAGVAGGAFFKLTPATPGASAAANFAVAITNVDEIAVGKPLGGALDGSMGDAMAQLGKDSGGPDALWTAFVADIGVTSRSAKQSAVITEATRSNAEGLQMSNASVDVDEEAVNMLTYQRAYEGAARVLTAIDAMLDTLINRTGLVGR
ncbi:flagellar hook-associated protein FlgK [Pengzhenrongella frigida]|uniref:Flagellar hook-associated protein 1 n=1 Tax=Pengzhenrongella frigida TaxID=1259133 RepID=A0A4V1ZGX2_9MICO|nr:flagellar hook-associated protein FlgK [Cellulomonas sp. HLT2-17]RYV50034.1 flagellar hook-associated protein FlgK [Cellulomonas sp. HLT2-17]